MPDFRPEHAWSCLTFARAYRRLVAEGSREDSSETHCRFPTNTGNPHIEPRQAGQEQIPQTPRVTFHTSMTFQPAGAAFGRKYSLYCAPADYFCDIERERRAWASIRCSESPRPGDPGQHQRRPRTGAQPPPDRTIPPVSPSPHTGPRPRAPESAPPEPLRGTATAETLNVAVAHPADSYRPGEIAPYCV